MNLVVMLLTNLLIFDCSIRGLMCNSCLSKQMHHTAEITDLILCVRAYFRVTIRYRCRVHNILWLGKTELKAFFMKINLIRFYT